MTPIEVLGITLRRNVEWDRQFCIIAFGDIALPELGMTLRGCALARNTGRIVALPPKVPSARPDATGGIQWAVNGEFAHAVRDKLLGAYRAMGGEMPPATTRKPDSADATGLLRTLGVHDAANGGSDAAGL